MREGRHGGGSIVAKCFRLTGKDAAQISNIEFQLFKDLNSSYFETLRRPNVFQPDFGNFSE